MSNHKINAAIQLLPIDTKEVRWDVVDRAIALIHNSGLNYKVCPFETVVEGTMPEVMTLLEKIKNTSLEKDCQEILINIKIHAAQRDLSFNEKLEKY
ncbi:MAG: thiamine-binding protein [Sphingobacteriaceae bacterium]|nr:thiamine-binding protein [Sphingobacteriaceae bacterium]